MRCWFRPKEGLKTTYYLRTLGASSIEKSIVDEKALRKTRKEFTAAEKIACSIEAMRNGEECKV